jgi:hypothetical protein
MGSRLGKIFGGLFGAKGGDTASGESAEGIEYKGHMIHPAARREGSQWLTVGVIRRRVGDEVKEHRFIRADIYATKEDADAFSVTKAKQIIDEQGDGLFEEE